MEADEVPKDTKPNLNFPALQSKKFFDGRAALFDTENPESNDFPARQSFDVYRDALYRSVKFQEQEYKSGNTKVVATLSQDLLKSRIAQKFGWACTTEATDGAPIDIFAISVNPPYRIALIQVKSAFDSRTIHINPDRIKSDRGPVWIIVAETTKEPLDYAFLIFFHIEFKKFVTKKENSNYYGIDDGYDDPQYCFSVPRNLEKTRFEKFKDKWWKLEKSARLYG
jgi:hypothetical protein